MFAHRAVIVACLASLSLAFADAKGAEPAARQESPASEDRPAPSEAERERRGVFMRQEVDLYTVGAAPNLETRLPVTSQPVLRYSNPVRNFFSDGAVFLWLDKERPLAAAVISIRGRGNVVREFAALADRALECRRDGKVVWAPPGAGLADQPLNDAPRPDSSDKRRLRQMRDIARQFRVLKAAGKDVELRLMTQPVYRYAAADQGIVDGAVFAFVEATDPDFLLIVEARQADAGLTCEWRYTLARMSSTPLKIELDGKQVWSAEGYWSNPRSVNDPYAEMPFGVYPPQ